MNNWIFRVFLDHKRIDVIDAWLQSLPDPARAKIRTRIRYLETLDTQRIFPINFFRKLKGYADIYELKVIFNNIQYRPLCCIGPGDNEITLLVPAIEQGDTIKPKNAPKIAEKRCKLIHQDGRYVGDFV